MDIELGLEMQANTQLEKENRLLKSLLYCTTRSCNNCGKVNCENFQRQRKDCCENWVSYKDYIKQLEAQIEKMKSDVKQGQSYWNSCEMQYDLYQKLLDEWEIKEK